MNRMNGESIGYVYSYIRFNMASKLWSGGDEVQYVKMFGYMKRIGECKDKKDGQE